MAPVLEVVFVNVEPLVPTTSYVSDVRNVCVRVTASSTT